MIVVTDTSVVLNLCLLGLDDVLATLFGEVQAPPAVKDEFVRLANVDPRFSSLAFPPFIVLSSPGAIHPLLLTPRLHRGECEALSLAAEIQASRVLMDERAGRAAASKLGLQCLARIDHRSSWLRLALVDSEGVGVEFGLGRVSTQPLHRILPPPTHNQRMASPRRRIR